MGDDLLVLYDRSLPVVYGYLVSRCGSATVAEDLTAETMLAAVDAWRRGDLEARATMTTAWLIGVARHKLVDHWRRLERTERITGALAAASVDPPDDWEGELDRLRADDVLARLAPHHRAVLTLRYVDDLAVGEVAHLLGRTVTATEALLQRAKRAFRMLYTDGSGDHG